MKWWKHDSNDSESPMVVELIEKHGLKGHYFWMKINEVLATYFNPWCPGCYKFKTRIFYAFFYPYIRDKRTMRAMLDLLHSEHRVFSHITGLTIYIYFPEIIKKADNYAREAIRKKKEGGEEQPDDARELAFLCANFAPNRSKTLNKFASGFIEKKGLKGKM